MSSLNRPAVVVRSNIVPEGVDRYLRLAENGGSSWIEDLAEATVFNSMRDAARVAARLPARLRAFGLPRGAEGLMGLAC